MVFMRCCSEAKPAHRRLQSRVHSQAKAWARFMSFVSAGAVMGGVSHGVRDPGASSKLSPRCRAPLEAKALRFQAGDFSAGAVCPEDNCTSLEADFSLRSEIRVSQT